VAADPFDFPTLVRRLYRIMTALGIAGTVFCLLWWDLPVAASFALGAGLGALNFQFIRMVVETLGESGKKPRSAATAVLALRFLILGLSAFVILRVLEIEWAAALAGLFIAVVAVLIEAVYELTLLR
jgi:hypothetical protein